MSSVDISSQHAKGQVKVNEFSSHMLISLTEYLNYMYIMMQGW